MNLVDFVYSDFPEAQEKRKVYSPWITTKKQKPPGPYIFDYNNEGERDTWMEARKEKDAGPLQNWHDHVFWDRADAQSVLKALIRGFSFIQ